MIRAVATAVAVYSALSFPAAAVTVSNGVVLFNQADAVAGSITPGDTPGFPVTISVSGSYRLAGNLAPTAGAIGIDVTAAEVTIDLAGFRLAGGTTALRGINGSARALTVINGTVRGFSDAGIRVTSDQLLVENMRISDNGAQGVYEFFGTTMPGSATIKASEILNNQHGIICNAGCLVERNVISNNTASGVTLKGDGALVIGNTISQNSSGIITSATAMSAGIGDNSIQSNGVSITGSYTPLAPNACNPACELP